MAGNQNSGRRPQPTALRVLRGNPGKRRYNKNEPVMPPIEQDFEVPPVELQADAVACDEWRRVVKLLRDAKVITKAERAVVIALCQQWSRYLEASASIAKAGLVVKGPGGGPITNPYLRISDTALAHCQRMWAELGLTPSSRSKVSTVQDSTPKELSKWEGIS